MATRTSTIATILGLVLCVSCAHRPVPFTPEPQYASSLEDRRELLMHVKKGMSEKDVIGILGKPDEVRLKRRAPWYVGAEFEWAYGSPAPGAFALVGLVIFDKNAKVFIVDPATHPSPCHAPRSSADEPVPSRDGMICVLGSIKRNKSGWIVARVKLVNNGKKTFRYKHDNTGIVFNLIEDIYDRKGVLVFREYWYRSHSPYSLDRAEWPVMVIPPGKNLSEKFHPLVGTGTGMLGKLARGKYYLRVAFPSDRGKYCPSNLIEFEIPPADPN